MTLAAAKNLGDAILATSGSDTATATAAGAGDATEVVGVIIDRASYGYALSGAALIRFKAVLAATKTLTYAYTVEHGDAANLSDATTYASGTATQAATGGAGGATVRDVYGIPVDLRGAKRYLRLKFTPDLSNTASDTLENSVVWVFSAL